MMQEPTQNQFDLDDLLHPARGYEHPRQVLRDTDLTLNEKRAILASWASDACAVEAEPALRMSPGGRPVQVDDVLDALRELDRQSAAGEIFRSQRYRAATRRERILGRRTGRPWTGPRAFDPGDARSS
jgi:hypothetical protein